MTDPDVKTCQCCGGLFRRTKGRTRKEFETRKYCGAACTGRAIPRRARPKRDRCFKDLHDLDEANTRVDGRGDRSCKACAADSQRKRDRRGQKRKPKPAAPPRIPSTAPVVVVPRVPPTVERPVWRPGQSWGGAPGWAPTPQVGGA